MYADLKTWEYHISRYGPPHKCCPERRCRGPYHSIHGVRRRNTCIQLAHITQTWGQLTVSISLTAPFWKAGWLRETKRGQNTETAYKKARSFPAVCKMATRTQWVPSCSPSPPNRRIFQEIWSLIDDRAVLTSAVSSNPLWISLPQPLNSPPRKFITVPFIAYVTEMPSSVFTHPVVLPYLTATRTRPFMLLAQFCYLTLSKPETTCMCRSISCTSSSSAA